ncbi:MAG: 50S ribosomal protein L9 [Armatimonadetes bacterium]|nr:50S ribosomal protein L9 [Armatimonadota bacterium]NIM22832.1 50S ribosomal protein L9 [Armatimonadota bacterium]NIM66699.1 50S ribosomal protein L9 [Armatimonadota bacterium]NIM75256.1 50S ribosomal protein L9 [Armatimonadota bacterium]NIN04897.1 50S ribosomal protein L9 [Armatimonadota bacterium]
MKVILLEEIAGLGEAGTVTEVAGGYGRNFLIPRGLALQATARNMKNLEHTRAEITKKQGRLQSEAQALAQRLESAPLKIPARAGEEGRLHGSITTHDIAEALAAQDIEVDRRKIHLEEPIKVLGSHSVKIKLSKEVEAALTLEVVAEEVPAGE